VLNQDAAGGTPNSRSANYHNPGVALFDLCRFAEAEVALREAVRLAEVADNDLQDRVLSLEALAKAVRPRDEAEAWTLLEEADRLRNVGSSGS